METVDEVHFKIQWSPWGVMSKWVINWIVPSESGIFQFWVKKGRGIELLHTETTYYGGLRNTLREVIDLMAPSGSRLREIIGNREIWFRYSILASRSQLELLQEWYNQTRNDPISDSREIYLKELETLKRFPLPPPDIVINEGKRMADQEFGAIIPNPE